MFRSERVWQLRFRQRFAVTQLLELLYVEYDRDTTTEFSVCILDAHVHVTLVMHVDRNLLYKYTYKYIYRYIYVSLYVCVYVYG